MISRCRRPYARMRFSRRASPSRRMVRHSTLMLESNSSWRAADAFAKLNVLLPAVDGFFVALDAVGDLADGQPFGAKSAACSDLADLANEVGIWWAAPSRFRAVPTPLRPQEAFDGQANWASANNCPRLTPIAVRRARQPHLRSSTMAFRPVKRTRVLPPGSLCRRGGQQTGDGQGRRLCRNHPRAKMRATGTRLLV